MQRLEWRWTFGHRHDRIHRFWGVKTDKAKAASLARHFVHHHHVIRQFTELLEVLLQRLRRAIPRTTANEDFTGYSATCVEDRTSDILRMS